MKILIKTISHKKQRYPTVGDYWKSKGTYHFRVSKFGNKYMQLAVILHELIEAFLCEKEKINWKKIDKFDIEYEKARLEGKKYAPCGCKIKDEPGIDKHAPYYKQHKFATKIEKMFIKALGYKWEKYEKEVNKL